METIKKDDIVMRLSNDYTHGRKGEVIEIDEKKMRARVSWYNLNLRTWVKFSALEKIRL